MTSPAIVVESLKPYFQVTQSPAEINASLPAPHPVISETPWQRDAFQVGSVNVTGRKGWKADLPLWENEVVYYNTTIMPLATYYDRIVIHHTNNSQNIRANEQKEQKEGFAAIGYHFFIDKKGNVFEGRPLEVMGSHAGRGTKSGPLNDPDWGAIGIVLQGDYHKGGIWPKQIKRGEGPWFDKPKSAMLESLKKLVLELQKKYGIHKILMHKEIQRAGTPTVCPGNQMYPHVEELIEELEENDK